MELEGAVGGVLDEDELKENKRQLQQENEKKLKQDLIKQIKSNLILNPYSIVGPIYQSMNKMCGDLYFGIDEELKGIFHLTEAHAATLRLETVVRYDQRADQMKLNKTRTVPLGHGINKDYVKFDSELQRKEEEGLIARLRDMPKEWTVVQITRENEPEVSLNRLKLRPDYMTKPSCLYITRLPCGETLDEDQPFTVKIAPPQTYEKMSTIFDLMKNAVKDLRTKNTRAKVVLKARNTAAKNIREVVNDLSDRVLREWRCLLLGSLCRKDYRSQVRDCINEVMRRNPHYSLSPHYRQMLYALADGAVNLSSDEIIQGVASCVSCPDLLLELVQAVERLREDMSVLLAARRHPVILILDEELDPLPWEMISVLKKHPVSRVPSIHFLHALYHEHKDHIVDGCRVVTQLDLGFYIVNPDQDLKKMESRLTKFLEERVPQWVGVKGCSPSQEQFCEALVKHNIFLYCGHFNGSHFLRPDDICNLRVVALPLLFGCSSVALQEVGGRASPSGISYKYIIAGSACTVGMLWTVTSDDTDCMTVTLLNSWLPGHPVDLTEFRSAGDMLVAHREAELLRLLRHAREAAHLYSNAASLIARGLPIKMQDG